MKKLAYLSLAAVAMLTAACNNEMLTEEVANNDLNPTRISFETYSPSTTRGAENSDATEKHGLNEHHDKFMLWGWYTPAGQSQQLLFNNEEVTYKAPSGPWLTKNARFWDMNASYEFLAAAPFNQPWTLTANRERAINDVTLTGETLPLVKTTDADATPNVNANFKDCADEDLMISHKAVVTKVNRDPVALEFDHILSRFNITARVYGLEDVTSCTINSIKIGNLVKKGSFSEATAAADPAGSYARWTLAADKFAANAIEAAANVALTPYKQVVYQGLVIPQPAAFEEVEPNGLTPAGVAAAEPELQISYTIVSKDGYTQTNTYTYNLAKAFGKTDVLPFNEGWMNTLNILINLSDGDTPGPGPIVVTDRITFTAQVYQWAQGEDKTLNAKNQ